MFVYSKNILFISIKTRQNNETLRFELGKKKESTFQIQEEDERGV